MLGLEGIDKGIDFSTVNQFYNNYKMIDGLGFMFMTLFIFIFFTWYFTQVIPNEFGTRKHPFFFLKNLKSKSSKSNFKPENNTKISVPTENYQGLETERDAVEGLDEEMLIREEKGEIVSINNVTKIYSKSNPPAVSNLSLKMYQDQIFVLLGHNGAGKSTTISLLTGLLSMTSGTATIFGKSVANEMDEIRKMIGVCPQHDILYNELTVYEHLEMFAIFKGVERWLIASEVHKLVGELNLNSKINSPASELSGGQRRRLSLGIALIGGSKFILLDEPTSGMDSTTRRFVWDVLRNAKTERIILLTTHFMDEADYLGDRIAIISKGSLRCAGSSVFLKNKFGIGYNLTFVKASHESDSKIKGIVCKFIPESNLLSEIASEISFQLPMTSISKFQELFNYIDSNKESIGVLNYGISITTLEEVFLMVANGENVNTRLDIENTKRSYRETEDNVQEQIDYQGLGKGKWLFWRQFRAFFIKKFLFSIHDFKGLSFEVLLPCILIIISILLIRSPKRNQSPQRILTPALYSPLPVYISGPASTSFSNYLSKEYFIPQLISSPSLQIFDSQLGLADSSVMAGIYLNEFPQQSSNTTQNIFNYTILYRTNAPELGAMLVGQVNQIALQILTNKSFTITPVNDPVPFTYAQREAEGMIDSTIAILIYFVGFSFLPASILSYVVYERVNKVKHMQIISGGSTTAYWLGMLVADWIKYQVVAIFFCFAFKFFGIELFCNETNWGPIFAIFILSALPMISILYAFSFRFNDEGSAQLFGYLYTYLLGALLAVIAAAFRYVPSTRNFIANLKFLLRLIPSFSLASGIVTITNRTTYAQMEGDLLPLGPFDAKNSYYELVYLLWTGPFYLLLLFAIEYFISSKPKSLISISKAYSKFKEKISISKFLAERRRKNSKIIRVESQSRIDNYEDGNPNSMIIEEDVALENNLVACSMPGQFLVKAQNLTKIYSSLTKSSNQTIAVKSLSLGIQPGECFGLLGTNGAGKTSTFKMFTGDESITNGSIRIMDLDVESSLSEVRDYIGYCPQFDSLLSHLTVKEHLRLYCNLRGIPTQFHDSLIASKILQLDLTTYSDYQSRTLSGGNKRKLSVAIATLGNPSVILLDEPSTGMDPEARRFMWNVISQISNSTSKRKSCVILTTHLMEEAEALCSRIGILVEGRFKCLGSIQHIKAKYSRGYEIEIKLHNPTAEEVNNRIRATGRRRSSTFRNSEISEVLNQLSVGNILPEIHRRRRGSSIMIEAEKAQGCPIEMLGEFVLNEERCREAMAYVKERLGNFTVIEHFKNYFRINFDEGISIGNLFGFFERNKVILMIQSYSIRQPSVEQIFNDFANERIQPVLNKVKEEEIEIEIEMGSSLNVSANQLVNDSNSSISRLSHNSHFDDNNIEK